MFARRCISGVMQTFRGQMRYFSIAGLASPSATRTFIENSDISLYHKFDKSGLFINPIIHGAPKLKNLPTKAQNSRAVELLLKAVLINRSNCIVVADYSQKNPWFLPGLDKLISPETYIKREEIVTVALLGVTKDVDDLHAKLEEISNKAGLQSVDIVMIEINDSNAKSQSRAIAKVLGALITCCETGKILSFGVSFDLAPYKFHTPPEYRIGPNAAVSLAIEQDMKDSAYCDVVMYTVSPTIAIPGSYMSLKPSKKNWDAKKHGPRTGTDISRNFTRIALDPFTCRRGMGSEETDLTSELVLRDPKKLAALEQRTREFMRYGMTRDELLGRVPRRPEPAPEDVPSFRLVDGSMDRSLEHDIGAALDGLCPQLASTPRLQDKALRTVLSVGMDVVLVDPESSVAIGKLKLTPNDLLDSDDTEEIFGSFLVPTAEELKAAMDMAQSMDNDPEEQ